MSCGHTCSTSGAHEFLLFLCLSTVVWLYYDCSSVGLEHFELRFVENPCQHCCTASHESKSQEITAKRIKSQKIMILRLFNKIEQFDQLPYISALLRSEKILKETWKYFEPQGVQFLGEAWHSWQHFTDGQTLWTSNFPKFWNPYLEHKKKST